MLFFPLCLFPILLLPGKKYKKKNEKPPLLSLDGNTQNADKANKAAAGGGRRLAIDKKLLLKKKKKNTHSS